MICTLLYFSEIRNSLQSINQLKHSAQEDCNTFTDVKPNSVQSKPSSSPAANAISSDNIQASTSYANVTDNYEHPIETSVSKFKQRSKKGKNKHIRKRVSDSDG